MIPVVKAKLAIWGWDVFVFSIIGHIVVCEWIRSLENNSIYDSEIEFCTFQ